MASAKGTGSSRRSSSSKSSRKKEEEPAVSPARWAGVALVIAAIVGAIFLAMISPSEPSAPSQPAAVADVDADTASPSPSPTVADDRVPVVRPSIVLPEDGTRTAEFEIAVDVDLPLDDAVPKRLLSLYVYLGDQDPYRVDKPKTGTTVTVQGVRLAPGENTLTAALGGPGGPGPVSEPIMVILDEDAPQVEIISPKNKYETYEDGVLIELTSEIGTTVRILNEANGNDKEVLIGPAGQESQLVRLKRGRNRIIATSIDEAGQETEDIVNVLRLDGRPTVNVKHPKAVDPPEEPRIVVDVTDSDDKPMKDAEVHFSLVAPDRTDLSEIVMTGDRGRAVWNPVIEVEGGTADVLELGIVVFSPYGEKKTVDRKIQVR